MVLRDAEVVPGDAGVFPAVYSLRHVDLQRSVLMEHVGISVQHAGAAVLKPAQAQRMIHIFIIHSLQPIQNKLSRFKAAEKTTMRERERTHNALQQNQFSNEAQLK